MFARSLTRGMTKFPLRPAAAPRFMCGTTDDGKLSTETVGKSTNIRYHEGTVSRDSREEILNQRGCIIWMTGLSGSGKSTIAYTLEHALVNAGKLCMVLDGDNVRTGLNSNLGFSGEDRTENIRRIAEVAKLFANSGVITIVSFISPYEKDRKLARGINPPERADFVECFLNIPIEVCEERDPKGLYKKARAGMIKGFTGIDDPYEAPTNPEIEIMTHDKDGNQQSPGDIAEILYKFLNDSGYLGPVRQMPWSKN